MLHGIGSETGVDLERLIDAGEFICAALGQSTNSRVGRAMLAKRRAS
jgi:hydroxymethylglutaryl-CoA lyase